MFHEEPFTSMQTHLYTKKKKQFFVEPKKNSSMALLWKPSFEIIIYIF